MKNKGISLIVLIITIIVIVITATAIIINIAQVNIITNASQAVVKQDFKTMQDELNLYYADQFANTKGKFKSETFNANETSSPSIYDVMPSLKNSKYDGKVSVENGSIVLSDEMDEQTKEWASEAIGKTTVGEVITTEEIADEATTYYGKTVNYKTGNSAIDSETKWQILHCDGNNVYIITKDYIPTKNAPKTSSGLTVEYNEYKEYKYASALRQIVNDYSGTNDITTSNPARIWISKYLDKYSNNTMVGKATAYMLDTNLWGTLYKGENAKYAIGGPTIEMIVASYNKTHDEKSTVPKLYLQVNEDGYYVEKEENSTVGFVSYINNDGEYNHLYILNHKDEGTYGYYIASPSAFINKSKDPETDEYIYTKNIMLMGFNSTGAPYYKEDYKGGFWNDGIEKWNTVGVGLRPVVCLKDNISLQKRVDGSFDIVK